MAGDSTNRARRSQPTSNANQSERASLSTPEQPSRTRRGTSYSTRPANTLRGQTSSNTLNQPSTPPETGTGNQDNSLVSTPELGRADCSPTKIKLTSAKSKPAQVSTLASDAQTPLQPDTRVLRNLPTRSERTYSLSDRESVRTAITSGETPDTMGSSPQKKAQPKASNDEQREGEREFPSPSLLTGASVSSATGPVPTKGQKKNQGKKRPMKDDANSKEAAEARRRNIRKALETLLPPNSETPKPSLDFSGEEGAASLNYVSRSTRGNILGSEEPRTRRTFTSDPALPPINRTEAEGAHAQQQQPLGQVQNRSTRGNILGPDEPLNPRIMSSDPALPPAKRTKAEHAHPRQQQPLSQPHNQSLLVKSHNPLGGDSDPVPQGDDSGAAETVPSGTMDDKIMSGSQPTQAPHPEQEPPSILHDPPGNGPSTFTGATEGGSLLPGLENDPGSGPDDNLLPQQAEEADQLTEMRDPGRRIKTSMDRFASGNIPPVDETWESAEEPGRQVSNLDEAELLSQQVTQGQVQGEIDNFMNKTCVWGMCDATTREGCKCGFKEIEEFFSGDKT